VAGNEYQADEMTGRYDASITVFKRVAGRNFLANSARWQGIVFGDVKVIALMRSARGNKMVIIAINSDLLKVMGINSMK
jgi:hypothetical protein